MADISNPILPLLKAAIEVAEATLAVADSGLKHIDKRQNHKKWLEVWGAREQVEERLFDLYRQWYQATKETT